MIPSFKPGIMSSNRIRGINSGGGGAQLYTMYSLSTNFYGEAGGVYSYYVREPIELWGGASGATAIAMFKGTNGRTTSSSKIFYIDTSNKLFEMSGTAGIASFTQVGASAFWGQISTGYGHILAITTGGTLYGWGLNSNGQVGVGDTSVVNSPTQIGTSTWSKVSCGNYHSLGIRTDGTLWAWGSNGSGRLGDGTTTQRTSPVQIGLSAGWTDISAGSDYSLGIYATGGSSQLFAWGYNSNYRLGDGTQTTRTSPVRIGSATDWSKIRANESYSFGIRTNGDLYGWGDNFYYQLGDGTSTTRTTPFKIGSASDWSMFSKGFAPSNSQSSHVIKTNNKAYASGSFNLFANRGIYDEFGTDFSGYTAHKEVTAVANLLSIDYGYNSTFFLDSSGKIKFCGDATHIPGFTATAGISFSWNPTGKSWKYATIASNIQDGGFYEYFATLAIDENDYLWAWGENRTKSTNSTYPDAGFYLGTTAGAVQTLSPVKVGTSTWSKVEAGSNHVLAIKTDGTLWSWGINNKGQLGIGSTTDQREPVQVGSDSNWASISCGFQTSYAIKTNGTLWAWGLNTGNQLGDGTTTQRNSPVQIGSDTNWSAVSAGQIHCMALKTTGTLWGWGTNTHGRIGDNTTTTRSSPVQIGSDTNWSKVSAGSHNTYAIKTTGTLWGWGNNEGGQVGNGEQSVGVYIPTQIGSDTNWIDVSAGWGYQTYNKFYYYPLTYITTFATKSNGTLWTWGRESGNGAPYTGAVNITTPTQSSPNHSNWSIAPKSKTAFGNHRIALIPI